MDGGESDELPVGKVEGGERGKRRRRVDRGSLPLRVAHNLRF